MPSALRSGGGSVFGSTPGPAAGEPLSATYSDLPSGLTWMPRGRLPSGAVAITAWVSPLMTVRSPDISLVTYTRTAGGGAGGAAAGAGVAAAGFAGSWLQADSASSRAGTPSARAERCRGVMGGMIQQHRLSICNEYESHQ